MIKKFTTFEALIAEANEYEDSSVSVDDINVRGQDESIDVQATSPELALSPEESKMAEIQSLQYERHIQQVEQIRSWVEEFDSLINMLNGTDEFSMQTEIGEGEEGTIFHEIFSKDSKRISRLAQDIASMSESFKGYLARSNDYKYKGR